MNVRTLSTANAVNIPNLLTSLRILLIPVLVVLLRDPGPMASLLAALTFFLACWSDFLDGYLARRYSISTPLGKLLDPLADKLIVMAAAGNACGCTTRAAGSRLDGGLDPRT